jgi:hypothetical protein
MTTFKRAFIPCGLLTLCLACSNDESPGIDHLPDLDTQAPAAVTDLRVLDLGTTFIQIGWTAPGDDSTSGTASEYDIRYSTQPVDDANWSSATECAGVPAPQPAGSDETYVLEHLPPGTTYYFAMKVADEVPNWSDLSNQLEASTEAVTVDRTPPAAVDNLEGALNAASRVHLRWTATGDDGYTGMAAEYDVRYYTEPIDAANWALASGAAGEPAPGAPLTTQKFIVKDLEAGTLYYFAIRVRDDVFNWSAISNVVSFLTPDCPYAETPCCFYGVSAYGSSSTAVSFQWQVYLGDAFPPSVYDIRYSTSPIDDWNWEQATRAPGQPSREDVGYHWWYFYKRIDGLSPATTYYLAMRGVDEDCPTPLVTATATTYSAAE